LQAKSDKNWGRKFLWLIRLKFIFGDFFGSKGQKLFGKVSDS